MAYRNYHTHTARCKHARGAEEEYIVKAVENGYDTLGFADHSPWPFADGHVSGVRMLPEELGDYVSTLTALKEKYKDRIDIRIGLECEYYGSMIGWIREQKEKFGLEYILLGNHTYDETEAFFFNGTDTPEKVRRYTDMVLAGMNTGLYDAVAHPELPLSGYGAFDGIITDCFTEIIKEAKRLDIPLEYNLQGNYYRSLGKFRGLGYPHETFWDMAGAEGCRAIVGIDAHFPDMITWTDKIDEARSLLASKGLTVIDALV